MRFLLAFLFLCAPASADLVANNWTRAQMQHTFYVDPLIQSPSPLWLDAHDPTPSGRSVLDLNAGTITHEGYALEFAASSAQQTFLLPNGPILSNWTVTISMDPFSLAMTQPVTTNVTYGIDNAQNSGIPHANLVLTNMLTGTWEIQGPSSLESGLISLPLHLQPANWITDLILERDPNTTEIVKVDIDQEYWVYAKTDTVITDQVVDGRRLVLDFGPSRIYSELSVTSIPEANQLLAFSALSAIAFASKRLYGMRFSSESTDF